MPEHCIEYVRVLLWSKENPFGGEGTAIDGDDPQHITWIMEKAQVSAKDEINNINVTLYSNIPLKDDDMGFECIPNNIRYHFRSGRLPTASRA